MIGGEIHNFVRHGETYQYIICIFRLGRFIVIRFIDSYSKNIKTVTVLADSTGTLICLL